MMRIAEKFLTEAERKQVEGRIAKAEERTSGEIVVMIAPTSHHYHDATLLGSSLFAVLTGLLVSLLSGKEHFWFFLAVFAGSFVILNELFRRVLPLKRLFVNRADMKEEVEEAAIRSFYRSGINRTAMHTGILVYISLFEHKVRVIADQGINAKVAEGTWQELVDTITQGFQNRQHAAALSAAIDRCGDILAPHFPRRDDDINELSNTIIIGGVSD